VKFIETTVVNLHHTSCDVVVARPSIFGNPFVRGRDGSRDEVIAKYREWFTRRLQDPGFYAAVLELRGKRLGCYCSPNLCHGSVIAEYLDSVEEQATG
jgi:hypothetical protein